AHPPRHQQYQHDDPRRHSQPSHSKPKSSHGRCCALQHYIGGNNTANGAFALFNNLQGGDNTAIGIGALSNNPTGSNNVALGSGAGASATTGSNNVYVGAGMQGVAGESDACYVKSIFGQTSATGIPVLINSNNKLGTTHVLKAL